MSNIPIPVALAFVVLIGWPTIKLIATLIARPRWARMHVLADELRRDPDYIGENFEALEAMLADAKGNPAMLVFPVIIPAVCLAFSISELGGNLPPVSPDQLASRIEKHNENLNSSVYGASKITKDARFSKISDLSIELSLLRYPICTFFSLISLLVSAPVVMVAILCRLGVEGVHVIRVSSLQLLQSCMLWARALGHIAP